uniref:Protein kinase domain-containing protein n=1 Tax=Panagrolaimus sp. ES5 TaxID=591445 RepID=A0AC34FA99_9BILA
MNFQDALDYSSIELKSSSNQQRQKSEQLISKRSSLLPPSTSIRRHASLAVDNPSQQLSARKGSSSASKRGSVAMEQIKKIDLDEVYSVFKQLGTGRFGYVKLAEHKQSKANIAIKFFPRPQIKQSDFIREYNFSFFLSAHANIINTYDGMFQTNDDSAFFFVQEFCPHASLREAVEASQGGIGETAVKEILSKVLSAVEFMHNENLVHRNLKAENILIFDKTNYSRVKITDFGLTRKIDSTVKYLEYVSSYHAPELCETVVNEVLTVKYSIDVWALAIIFYYCLKGRFPWQKATIMCKPYWEWEQWLKRKSPSLPKRWDAFSDKSLKLFKKCFTPKAKDRWSVKDMRKLIAKEKLLKQPKVNSYYIPGTSAIATTHSNAQSTNTLEPQSSSTVCTKSENADEYVYYPEETSKSDKKVDESKAPKKRSLIQQWINTTLNTMAEISEQVVSARDE